MLKNLLTVRKLRVGDVVLGVVVWSLCVYSHGWVGKILGDVSCIQGKIYTIYDMICDPVRIPNQTTKSSNPKRRFE